MYKRVMVVVILIFPLLASAADWQVLADTKLGQLRLDRASVSKADKLTKAVLAYEFKDSQKIAKPPYDTFNRREDEVLVDCDNPLLGVITRRFFDGDKLVNTATLKTVEVKFNPPAPDTMAENVVKAVCAVVLASKP